MIRGNVLQPNFITSYNVSFQACWYDKFFKSIPNKDIANPAKKFWVVKGYNPIEYASHLEYGHKLRNGKRWKGRFVGDLSMNEARYYCMQQLQKAIDKAMKKN